MLDLGRFGNIVTQFIGSSGNDALGSILSQVQEGGLNGELLSGLDASQVLSVFAENGIDVAQLDIDQLTQLGKQFGVELPVGDILSQIGTGSQQ